MRDGCQQSELSPRQRSPQICVRSKPENPWCFRTDQRMCQTWLQANAPHHHWGNIMPYCTCVWIFIQFMDCEQPNLDLVNLFQTKKPATVFFKKRIETQKSVLSAFSNFWLLRNPTGWTVRLLFISEFFVLSVFHQDFEDILCVWSTTRQHTNGGGPINVSQVALIFFQISPQIWRLLQLSTTIITHL